MDHNRGGGIVKFIRLHRRSIVIGGVAGVVISGILRARRAYHDAMDMVLDAETQAAERRKAEQETRRKECCLERTSKECDVAFLRFITSLDDAIDNKIFSHVKDRPSKSACPHTVYPGKCLTKHRYVLQCPTATFDDFQNQRHPRPAS